MVFKKISMPVIIKRVLTLGIIVGIGFMCFNFIEKAEVDYKKTLTNNFVIGRVEFVGNSVNKVNINYINSNIKGNTKGKLTVKLKGSTQILVQDSNNKQKVVKSNELKIGDIITIYCPENSIDVANPEITAKKIMKKESSEKLWNYLKVN